MKPPRPVKLSLAALFRAGARCTRTGPRWRSTLEFHSKNPWVFRRLKEICQALKDKGWTRYSTRTLVAVLRFEHDLRTGGESIRVEGSERIVKLNDHHTAYYARMLIEAHPRFADFFELRRAEGDPTMEDLP